VTHNSAAAIIRKYQPTLDDAEIYELAAALTVVPQPDQLAERRSTQAGDCKLWSPRDALLAAVRDLDAGEINPQMLVVSFRQPTEDGKLEYRYYAAGVTVLEHVGLLTMEINHMLNG